MRKKCGDKRPALRIDISPLFRNNEKVFGHDIADQLGSEKAMRRMIGYLHNARPRNAEEIADEMLAICYDRETWRKKKETEYYNEKYNEQLNQEL